jgi:hypothetical protein
MTASDGAMDASVFPPFLPGAPSARRPAEPAPEAAAPETADDAAEDLPWLELRPGARAPTAEEGSGEYEPEPFRPEPLEPEPFDLSAMDAQGGAPHDSSAEDAGFPDWLAWDEQAATEAEAEIANAAPEPWVEDVIPGDDFMQMEAAVHAEVTDAAPWTGDLPVGDGSLEVDLPGAGSAVDEAPSPAAGLLALDATAAEALAEVAGRLERIARTLRDDPGDLLSGASADPLDLLVAGYALGLAQGRAHGRSG